SGKITKIAFREGQTVQKGDLLFEIEDADWKANVEAAQANVESAHATIQQFEAKIKEIDALIRYREKSFKRNQELYRQSSAVSLDDMESTESILETAQAQRLGAEASLKEARAALRTAQATLALKQLDLDRTKIYSEITGKAGRLAYTLGNYVNAQSTPLITVAQLDPIYIRFNVSEKDFTEYFEKVSKNKDKDFIQVILSNGHVYERRGKFAFYDNAIDTGTDTITVWGIMENPTGILNPGGVAKVTVQTKTEALLPAVPTSAIVHDSRGQFVYVVDAEQKAHQRRIVLGPESEGLQCIAGGLKAGETIIVDGTHKVKEGMPVKNDPPEESGQTPPKESNNPVPSAASTAPAAPVALTAPATPAAPAAVPLPAPTQSVSTQPVPAQPGMTAPGATGPGATRPGMTAPEAAEHGATAPGLVPLPQNNAPAPAAAKQPAGK
ncbi:MAG: efflux RND transporter periplasmic adaptor subunit, partial [Thermoguttaceae bacterium]|nr:efflux RND transporter periplasmic adaptor subunit [Thermoguttaceae bacterium]